MANEWITDKYLKEKIATTARAAMYEYKLVAAEGERIRSDILYLKNHLARCRAFLDQLDSFIKEGEEEE